MRTSAGGTCVAGIISPFLLKRDLGGGPQGLLHGVEVLVPSQVETPLLLLDVST